MKIKLQEKARRLKADIIFMSRSASIKNDLGILIVAGWIELSSIDKIAEKQILQYEETRCKCELSEEQLYLID